MVPLIAQSSAEELVQAVEESVRKTLHAWLQCSPQRRHWNLLMRAGNLLYPSRTKMQFRVYMDDKLERLFKMYSDRIKLDANNLVFLSDGDKISSNSTPDSLRMEENDIIEVHVKSS